ncbi:MAG TPA: Uma2 family endonuclease, partial [Sphingomonas sp.]|nr:Uma2 family endonuclease [Sphingomonas sp.]
ELIDGELERMAPPLGGHAARQSEVGGLLWQVARAAGLFSLVEMGIQIDDYSVLVCDVALARSPVDVDGLADPATLLLVVEIAETTLLRDMGLKRAAYAAAAIAEYWVVDGKRSVVHVHREPVEGDYAFITTVRFGEPLAVPGTGSSITIG